jgi:hypothetical protein
MRQVFSQITNHPKFLIPDNDYAYQLTHILQIHKKIPKLKCPRVPFFLLSLLLNRIFGKIVSIWFFYFKYTANLKIRDGFRKDNQSAGA